MYQAQSQGYHGQSVMETKAQNQGEEQEQGQDLKQRGQGQGQKHRQRQPPEAQAQTQVKQQQQQGQAQGHQRGPRSATGPLKQHAHKKQHQQQHRQLKYKTSRSTGAAQSSKGQQHDHEAGGALCAAGATPGGLSGIVPAQEHGEDVDVAGIDERSSMQCRPAATSPTEAKNRKSETTARSNAPYASETRVFSRELSAAAAPDTEDLHRSASSATISTAITSSTLTTSTSGDSQLNTKHISGITSQHAGPSSSGTAHSTTAHSCTAGLGSQPGHGGSSTRGWRLCDANHPTGYLLNVAHTASSAHPSTVCLMVQVREGHRHSGGDLCCVLRFPSWVANMIVHTTYASHASYCMVGWHVQTFSCWCRWT